MTSGQATAQLSDHLGYWLRLVSNDVSRSFARKLADEDVTVVEWVVLRILFEGDKPPSKLASMIGMTRGAISKLADRLIARGLVSRTGSSEDGRMQALGLTRKGSRLVPRLAGLADDNDRQFFGVLNADERVLLRAIMEKLAGRHGLVVVPTD